MLPGYTAAPRTPQHAAHAVSVTLPATSAGVLCVGLPAAECERLELPLMVPSAENEEEMYTAFTVTVDLREGVTTGISASDRCTTIRALGSANTRAADLRKPGHIFPLIAREHGVLARPGHTEAAVDLARLAGAPPCHVFVLAVSLACVRALCRSPGVTWSAPSTCSQPVGAWCGLP